MTKTRPGRFYRITESGRLIETIGPVDADVGVWICRRVEDFPDGRAPAGSATGLCSRCGASLVYNPSRRVDAPKVCMQCAGIEPLPIEPASC